MKHQASLRKIQSNRKNALSSTGPRTHVGKKNSSQNALKHGVFSSDVVITSGPLAENISEYHDLASKYIDYFHPEGEPELRCVKEMVDCQWRLRRVSRAEIGEIQIHARPPKEFDRRDIAKIPKMLSHATDRLEGELTALRRVREEFEQDRPLSADLEQQLGQLDKDDALAALCLRYHEEIKNRQAAGQAIDYSFRYSVCKALDHEIGYCEIVVAFQQDQREARFEAEQLARSLPSDAAAKRILMYESSLLRRYERAAAHLERLQRLRAGETIPAPVNVQISKED